MTLLNTGNAEEQYTLELQQVNYTIADLLTDQTPILDAWDGEASVTLRLNMPLGLEPGFYTLTVIARNMADNTVGQSLQISLEILDTAAVAVLDEDADQSYIPGDPPQFMEFEIRNDGNKADRFSMSLVVPDGMIADVSEVSPWLVPGETWKATVTFSFVPGTEGQLQLGVTATSQNDPSISATGNALYRVGSQNWLRIPSVIPLEIDTADADHVMELTVRNQYTTAQAVAMDLDDGDAGDYMLVRINSQDQNFVLQVGEERKVTVELIISETTLDNLDEDRKTVNFTVWARSETVSDAADAQMTVTMVRTAPVDTTGDEAEERQRRPQRHHDPPDRRRRGHRCLRRDAHHRRHRRGRHRRLGGRRLRGQPPATMGVKAAPVIPTEAPPQAHHRQPRRLLPAPAAAEAQFQRPLPRTAGARRRLAGGLVHGTMADHGQMWLEQNGRA